MTPTPFKSPTMGAATMAAILMLAPLAGRAAIVNNGSFENPLGTWSNTVANYMAVANGSTAITGWTVANAGGRGLAWAKAPTQEGYAASDGQYFVDLSGFGTESGPTAALQQMLQGLVTGQSYSIAIDYWGDRVSLGLEGSTLATAAAASSGWTRLTAGFVATGEQMLLSVGYQGTSGVAFVDNLDVVGDTGSGGTVPTPGSAVLAATALGALLAQRRRAKAQSQGAKAKPVRQSSAF
ncbi:MAG: hypothetical protein H6933_20620 [Burkholderiaceae bacterium]|nr:hypothetical protein [Rhodoferax sp.]MCP5287301.1 hypothetical protein [Burkholderiaceae bacterium]